MTTLNHFMSRWPASRWLAVALTLALATVVGAQGFVWPPAAGDRVAQGEAETTEIQAIEGGPGGSLSADESPNFAARPMTVAASQPIAAAPALLGGGQTQSGGQTHLGSQTQWKILENPNGPHAALIFDPVRQVFAVYHVDSASGQIMLKSVRNLSADLRLEQFNSGAPAPKDIQAMLNEAREPR